MACIFVIHGAGDQDFVERRLIKPLPVLGFQRWQSRAALEASGARTSSVTAAMKQCAAVLAVVTPTSALDGFRAEVARARTSGRPVIVVRLGGVATEPADAVWTALPSLSAGTSDEDLWRALWAVLPGSSGTSGRISGKAGVLIRWDEEVFSALLGEAVDRHDYHRGDELVATLARYLRARSNEAYPSERAASDLDLLRTQRQFTLMKRYGEAVLKSGVAGFKARRLYAQALIELRNYRGAARVLTRIVKEAAAGHPESFEARGLLGRIHKQQYVNSPGDLRARGWLSKAIHSYKSVYDEDPEQAWHGINAASLLLRGARDRLNSRNTQRARAIARTILDTLERRQHALGEGALLDVFDCATRVEAFVALEDFGAARAALDVYLAHPAMHAFEVSSTHRQFDEVLQLHDHPEGRELVDRLWRAVERHRASGVTSSDPTRATEVSAASEAAHVRPMLLRVSDPGWKPQDDVTDLTIQVRLGTVLSITGSAETIRSLMKDPSVIAVEDSRPSGEVVECSRSLPFIKVFGEYTGPAGTFSENGEHALIAIVDDGIDVLHRAFQDGNGQTRILGIWDQRGKTEPRPEGFDFGTFYARETIQKYVDENTDPNAAAFTVPAELSRNRDGHGTHVTSIAAGRKVGDFAGGVAPDAKILVVITAGAEAIGYSSAHLAALTFINQFATKAGMPVVVNLSQGMNAGAHDGRSALEVGFDEFSSGGRAPGRVVVKSAGNERGKRGHATVQLLPDTADTLTWRSWTDPGWNRDRLELWWNSINSFRFQLTAPSGQKSEWIDEANPAVKGRLSGGGPFRIELVKRHLDNGDSRLLVELGSGPGLNPLAEGEWTLEIQAVKVRTAGEIHAWLERGGSRPSEFTDSHTSEEMTLSVPGTAFSVITVGAVDASMPIKVGPFSSYGPTRDRRDKPDVVAPGVKVEAARGGTFDGIRPESGTSMAAPHVTGAIALLLSRAARPESGMALPTASQAGAALRQMAGNATGTFTPSHGYGLVDVAAFLTAF